jgi:secondary thiamine-phosphate synthase enzyme
VAEWATASGFESSQLTLFLRHTSTSPVVQENADPDVRADLKRFLGRLGPDGDALVRHRDEGPDDMPAHVRSALSAVQLPISMTEESLALGTWQGVYLWKHGLRLLRREVALSLVGE